MITIVPCTAAECAAVAGLWNAKRLDSNSCWFGADTVEEAYVNALLAAGFALSVAVEDASPVGFGLWCGTASAARLLAVAADSDEIYYHLLGEFCDWGLALGAQRGYAEIGTATTTERGRMDALRVVELVPIGFEPLEPGQNPTQRVPKLLRAECDLAVLKDAVTQFLEQTP